MTDKFISPWRGSPKTYEATKKQILERFGKKASEEYDPQLPHCLTFRAWQAIGYGVKPKEKSLQSLTIIEQKDKKTGKLIKRYPKKVHLFWKAQVQKMQ